VRSVENGDNYLFTKKRPPLEEESEGGGHCQEGVKEKVGSMYVLFHQSNSKSEAEGCGGFILLNIGRKRTLRRNWGGTACGFGPTKNCTSEKGQGRRGNRGCQKFKKVRRIR